MNRRRLTLAAILSATLAAFGSAAHAQAERTVRILVGFPPGGSIDIVARLLADKMKDELKTNIIIENRGGAGGRIAAELLKSAPADGSTLMITPVVVPVLAPLVFSKLNYNPATDFAPVGHVCNFGFAVTVPTALPAKNVAELVTWLKANPQKANFGSPAPGSLPHFFGEMLSREAGADMVHVPFAGGAALLGALVGNQVSAGSTWCSRRWNPTSRARCG
jgi:tripartite-type tricarboxylate transporter receptor subunit TctC